MTTGDLGNLFFVEGVSAFRWLVRALHLAAHDAHLHRQGVDALGLLVACGVGAVLTWRLLGSW